MRCIRISGYKVKQLYKKMQIKNCGLLYTKKQQNLFAYIPNCIYLCSPTGQVKLTSSFFIQENYIFSFTIAGFFVYPLLPLSAMNKAIAKVTLRLGAIYVETPVEINTSSLLRLSTITALTQLNERGFILDEKALRQFNLMPVEDQAAILDTVNDVYNLDMNWTPLVRGWQEPTGESALDHLLTAFAHILAECGTDVKGTRLECGHLIPDGTFDLSRYNGCPFCGRPFILRPGFTFLGQGCEKKELTMLSKADLEDLMRQAMGTNALLDATWREILGTLIEQLPVPDPMPEIPIKENAMIVAKYLMGRQGVDALIPYIKEPSDLLRFIWYIKTGELRVIRPQTLEKQMWNTLGRRHYYLALEDTKKEIEARREQHLLKFNRRECRFAAGLLNECDLSVEAMCEQMNPFREMWVHVIRALRLSEFARRKGYDKLRMLLDKFYRKDYYTAEGEVNRALASNDIDEVMAILKGRPGLFARHLFSLMLHFNPEKVISEFCTIADKLPLRMLLGLTQNAVKYFQVQRKWREIRTVTGVKKYILANKRVLGMTDDDRVNVISLINKIIEPALKALYSQTPMPGRKMYIAPELEKMVLPLGARSDMIQDVMAVSPGSTFPVAGDKIRLFLHWGKGLPAQAIDLDLSAVLLGESDIRGYCSFFSLSTYGTCHSGDMREIPDNVGTAEFIELDISKLQEIDIHKVVFYANSYTPGAIKANAMMGWMASENPMTVDEATGVAFDPSTVQFMLKVPDEMLAKGVLFGVLDVRNREITYIESSVNDQEIDDLKFHEFQTAIEAYKHMLTIDRALRLLAESRGMTIITELPADGDLTDIDIYDRQWSLDRTRVLSLLFPV